MIVNGHVTQTDKIHEELKYTIGVEIYYCANEPSILYEFLTCVQGYLDWFHVLVTANWATVSIGMQILKRFIFCIAKIFNGFVLTCCYFLHTVDSFTNGILIILIINVKLFWKYLCKIQSMLCQLGKSKSPQKQPITHSHYL